MAATKLEWVRAGFENRFKHPDLTNKAMDVILDRSDNIPLVAGQFFRTEAADLLTFKLSTVSNILNHPRKTEDSNPLQFEESAPGYDKTINLYTYMLGNRITATTVKIDKSGKALFQLSGLMDSGRRFIEAGMANVINTGASVAGADGSNIFANDHYHEDAAGGTWSNLETAAALTTTTYDLMRYNARKRTNEKGFVSKVNIKNLVVVPEKEQKARQISGSDLIPEDALNAINPWKGVKPIVFDGASSTTAWYGWGDLPEAMWGLHYAVLTAPVVKPLDYPNADYPEVVAGYYIKAQVGFGASQVKNMILNVGA